MFLFQTVGYVSFRHAKLTACREGRVRILEIECCLRLFCFFFPFLPFWHFHDQMHTHSDKEGAKRRERPKGDSEQFAALAFWITD